MPRRAQPNGQHPCPGAERSSVVGPFASTASSAIRRTHYCLLLFVLLLLVPLFLPPFRRLCFLVSSPFSLLASFLFYLSPFFFFLSSSSFPLSSFCFLLSAFLISSLFFLFSPSFLSFLLRRLRREVVGYVVQAKWPSLMPPWRGNTQIASRGCLGD